MNIDARHEVVLQSYLTNPLLWRGRKLQYRCYCVWRGRRCYVYTGAMAQVCALPYEPPSGDMAPEQHVTNVSCNVDSSLPSFRSGHSRSENSHIRRPLRLCCEL